MARARVVPQHRRVPQPDGSSPSPAFQVMLMDKWETLTDEEKEGPWREAMLPKHRRHRRRDAEHGLGSARVPLGAATQGF